MGIFEGMDRDKIEAFLERFTGFAASATTIGVLAVADRSGLTAYLGEVGGGTVSEIAEGARLDERYVEEILSGLAAAQVVDYDPKTGRFELPPEHALFIADDSSPYFMGGWMDMIPSMLSQVDGVANATRNGGGVGFDEFGGDMITGIDRGNSPSYRVFLTRKWLPAVPGLADRLTEGMRIADVGCGSGTAAILMAEAYSKCDVLGFDLSEQSIALARSRAEGVPNVRFETHGVEDIPIDPPFDLITTFDVIHDLVDPLTGLNRIREALAPDGFYLMMEPHASSKLEDNLHPRGALLYGVSTLHCMTQSMARGGAGLGAAWGRQRAEEYAERAGFRSMSRLDDISNRFSAFYLLRP